MIRIVFSQWIAEVFQSYREMFTVDEQVDALLEEMAELQQALLHARKRNDATNLQEEMADVLITLAQVYGRICDDSEVQNWARDKVTRMKGRIQS